MRSRSFIACPYVAALVLFIAAATYAQTTAFTHQGRLTDSSMPASGNFNFQFRIYDVPNGGSAVASQSLPNVPVANGIFTVELDFGAAAFDGGDRWLEIQVEATTLQPRQKIASVPYAIRSSSAATAANAAQLGGVAASNYLQTNGDGSQLTGLNASNIGSGTLNDARLSSNVALRNAANTFTANMTINANLSQTGTTTDMFLTNGFVARGSFGTGTIPFSGPGTRMMFYPRKGAFRVGSVNGSQWEDFNIGLNSIVMGDNSIASGAVSIALGSHTTASGIHTTAIGHLTTASGSYSTAMGLYASTDGFSGSFVYGDSSTAGTGALVNATAPDQFIVRAVGGLRFRTASDLSTGCDITTGNLSCTGSITGNFTNLNASNITSGTLADARLSSNVALRNAANTFTADQTINANLTQTGLSSNLLLTNGFVARGILNSGSIPIEGSGSRMMFYSNKAAFRAGYVAAAQWNDANVGYYSTAIGYDTTASGFYSTALGRNTIASNQYSTAMGVNTTASGSISTAMGNTTTASGDNSTAMGIFSIASGSSSTAMGNGTTASGQDSTAMGNGTTASGLYTTAMGRSASTNGMQGSFVYGDNSGGSVVNASAPNQFVIRAQHFWLGRFGSPAVPDVTHFLTTSTGAYLTTGGMWTNASSRELKTNFAAVNPRDVLQKVLRLPIQTWNYMSENAGTRHIGPMSQDFYKLFKVGSSSESIGTVDSDGVALAAIQGLNEELKDRDKKIEQLEQKLQRQQTVIVGLQKFVCSQDPKAEVCKVEK